MVSITTRRQPCFQNLTFERHSCNNYLFSIGNHTEIIKDYDIFPGIILDAEVSVEYMRDGYLENFC